MERIIIIADDLTGANDTGVQFCKSGYQTTVVIDPEVEEFSQKGVDVWAINTDTRGLLTSEAYCYVRKIAKRLNDSAKPFRIYKKIDSTLRGHPGAEVDALIDAFDPPFVLIVPSFPANQRIVENGSVIIKEQDREGKTVCHIPTVLEQEMTGKVGSIGLETVRKGSNALKEVLERDQKISRVFVIDAIDEFDLITIAQTINQLPKETIVVGSAGLASHLTVLWSNDIVPRYPLPDEGMKLFVIGSYNNITSLQVQELARRVKAEPIILNTKAVLSGDKEVEIQRIVKEATILSKRDKPVIIAVDTPRINAKIDVKKESATLIASSLGAAVKEILKQGKIKFLMATGGDTALNICRAIGAVGINLKTEILPGIPFGYLVGEGVEGLPVVTKAGGFGTPESLVKIFEYMLQDSWDEEVDEACANR